MDRIAYVCRYGRQDALRVRAWDMDFFNEFEAALVRIVQRENAASEE